MAIKKVKPTFEVSIGAAYFCMIKERNSEEIIYTPYEPTNELKVWEMDVIKTLGLTRNVAELKVHASGILFDTINRTTGADIVLGVVALPDDLLIEIEGITDKDGFTFNRTNDRGREFAFGYWGENSDGSFTMVWHPVCKLVPTEEAHNTSTDEITDPERSYTVRVIPWERTWRVRYSTARAKTAGKEPIDRNVFFAKPIYKEDQVPKALEISTPPETIDE